MMKKLNRRAIRFEQLEERMTPAAVTWDGGGLSTDWNNALNWSTDSLPGPADDVTIVGATVVHSYGDANINSLTTSGALTLSGGSISLAQNSGVTASGSFNFADGFLLGDGNLLCLGPMNWSGGHMAGAGATSVSGPLTISSGFASMRLDGRYFTYEAAATWTGGAIYVDNGAVFGTLNPAATLELQADAAMTRWTGVGDATFANKGTFKKTAGAGIATINVLYFDFGVGNLRSQSGEIRLTGGGAIENIVRADAGAVVGFYGGTTLLKTGALGLGAGVFRQGLGTISVDANVSFSCFEQYDGDMTGVGTLTTTGKFSWHGGFQSGFGITRADGGLDIFSSAIVKRLNGRTLATYGAGAWTGGTLYLDNGSNLTIGVGGLLDAQTSDDITRWTGVGVAQVNVSGTLRHSAIGDTGIFTQLYIVGTLQSAVGSFSSWGAAVCIGTLDAAAGASNVVWGGSFELQAGAQAIGSGILVIRDGSLAVNSNATATKVVQEGGTVTGPADLTVTGTYEWHGGFMTDIGTTKVQGGLSIHLSPLVRRLYGRRLETHGYGVWDGGFVWMDNGSQFIIGAGGILDVQTADDWTRWDAVGSALISIAGRLKRTTAGDTAFAVPINNNGTMESAAGSFSMYAGGNSSGEFETANGAAIAFSGGVHILQSGASGIGIGEVVLNGGTIDVAGSANFVVFVQTDGNLTGAANLTSLGKFKWYGGFMTGTGETRCNGGLDIFNSAISRRLYGRILKTNGPGVWGSGFVWMDNDSQFVIEQNGLLDVQTSDDWTRWDAAGSATVSVIGTLRHSVSAGDTGFFTTFNNSGLVQCLVGSFSFWASGTSTGVFEAVPNAANVIWGGSHSFQEGTQTIGAGPFIVRDGLLSIDGNSTSTNVIQEGGNVSGSAIWTVGDSYDWYGGFMTGAGETRCNGGLDIFNSAINRRLYGRTLKTNGPSAWNSGYVWSDNGSQFIVESNGVLDVQTSNWWARWDEVGTSTIMNQGLIHRPSAAGQTVLIADVLNLGMLVVETGKSMYVGGGFTQSAGLARVDGSLDPAGVAYIQGGVLAGGGSIEGPVTVIGTGGIGPGSSAGQLSINGNLTMVVGTTLDIELDGLSPGTGYDQLIVNGLVDLGGASLSVSRGFAPAVGSAFTILANDAADAVAGIFGGLNEGASITVAGLSFTLSYLGVGGTGNDVVLTAAGSTDTTAPTITAVYFSGTAWSAGFNAAAGNANFGYPAQTGAGQLAPMPWSTINTIAIQFSESVAIANGNLGVRGINVPTYLTTLTWDNATFVARFTFATPIETDRVLLDLDGDGGSAVADLAGNKLAGNWIEGVSAFPTTGPAGTDFLFRFVIAVGDVNRNGQVRNNDLNLVRNNLFVDVGQAGYSIYSDIDGNGLTRNADLNAVRNRLFVDPPAGPGPNGAARRNDHVVDRQAWLPIRRPMRSWNGNSPTATMALDALFAE